MLCKYFAQGRCYQGSSCPYKHEEEWEEWDQEVEDAWNHPKKIRKTENEDQNSSEEGSSEKRKDGYFNEKEVDFGEGGDQPEVKEEK